MSFAIAGAPWEELATAGFVHVRGFLSPRDVAKVSGDYTAQRARAARNGNYDVPTASPLLTWHFEPKLRAVSEAVSAATGIKADLAAAALYFATEKGVSFAWHQDHESFFIYQQHRDYLNFYVPIVKPERSRSNVCVVPFDRIDANAGRDRVVGSGACRFFPQGSTTRVCVDESGEEYVLPVDIERLKVTPELEPGDLLLMRGDVIHRTQDASTDRVAISFRRTSSSGRIRKSRLLAGGPAKRDMMRKNSALFGPLLECFGVLRRDEITAQELSSFYMNRAALTAAPERGITP
jgi:hypothetical protein